MSWTSVRRFYGLEKPFDFEVATPLLVSLAGAFSVTLVCLISLFAGALSIGTERFYFFLYIIILLVVAAALSRARTLWVAITLWCSLELALALWSGALVTLGGDPSLLPRNSVTHDDESETAFIYHPLLQFTPKPNTKVRIRIDWRDEDRFRQWLVNWNRLDGLDVTYVHNSFGLRGAEPSAADLRKRLIFVYGGSTTYDIWETQGETWVERLQAALDGKFTVLNLGVSGYSTVENLLQTALYQSMTGKQPVCAIYYVGWNDISNAHVGDPDPAYSNFHTLLQAFRRPEIQAAKYSPLLRLANREAVRRFDSIPRAPDAYGRGPVSGTDSQLERAFLEHVRTIIAINRSRGTKTLFIGQMLNRELLGSRPREVTFAFPRIRNGDIWPMQERFNTLLKEEAAYDGAGYLDAGVQNFSNADFADWGHFVGDGAHKFALLVANGVANYCQ